MHRCRLLMVLIAMCLSVVNGCGPTPRVIEGNLTLDRKPLTSGAIEFEPTEGSGRLLSAEIADGSYRITDSQAQALGTCIVRVISMQPTGRRIAAGPPAPPGTMIDEIADAIPAQYNTKSTLKVDLSTAGPHNFELLSHQMAKVSAPAASK
jgi:hypothetical protein